ncbi:MAG: hypothetical protein OXE42_01330 [Gammaproteobacteria bacterium]|nr:hypothetical protein [Gammaproteobacteria bacterium]
MIINSIEELEAALRAPATYRVHTKKPNRKGEICEYTSNWLISKEKAEQLLEAERERGRDAWLETTPNSCDEAHIQTQLQRFKDGQADKRIEP